MKVLLTGGAGFIGHHLASALLAEGGHELAVVDNFDPYYARAQKEDNLARVGRHGRLRLLEADLVDDPRVATLFAEFRPDVVVHLAARAGVRPSLERPADYMRTNVEGTARLLELARLNQVTRFVFASSSSVYGNNPRPFSEEQVVASPESPYAASKIAGELLCRTWHTRYGMSINALRFFTVYGPRQRPEMAIARFVDAMHRGEEIPVSGDGSSARDYTFVDDIIAGVRAAMERFDGYRVYNLGNSAPVTLAELVQRIEAAVGRPARVRRVPFYAGDVEATWAAPENARRDLGFSASVPLDEGLRRVVEWYRQEGARFHDLGRLVP